MIAWISLFFPSGKGAVFSYDPIGCIEHIAYTASGSAEPMIMPFFDCQVNYVLHLLRLFFDLRMKCF